MEFQMKNSLFSQIKPRVQLFLHLMIFSKSWYLIRLPPNLWWFVWNLKSMIESSFFDFQVSTTLKLPNCYIQNNMNSNFQLHSNKNELVQPQKYIKKWMGSKIEGFWICKTNLFSNKNLGCAKTVFHEMNLILHHGGTLRLTDLHGTITPSGRTTSSWVVTHAEGGIVRRDYRIKS